MTKKLRCAIFISGSGSNMEAIARACIEGLIPAEVVVVMSNKADAYGLERAKNFGIPAIVVEHKKFKDRVEHEKEIIKQLEPYKPIELVCLAGYMRVVTPYLINHFYNKEFNLPGVMNIHPADTRAYQGEHGYEFAMGLLPNTKRLDKTWITVHLVDPGVDTGPIIRQAPVDIYPDDTIDTLSSRGLKIEHQVYPDCVRLYAERKLKIEGNKVKILE